MTFEEFDGDWKVGQNRAGECRRARFRDNGGHVFVNFWLGPPDLERLKNKLRENADATIRGLDLGALPNDRRVSLDNGAFMEVEILGE